jgi:hypothetical protein
MRANDSKMMGEFGESKEAMVTEARHVHPRSGGRGAEDSLRMYSKEVLWSVCMLVLPKIYMLKSLPSR